MTKAGETHVRLEWTSLFGRGRLALRNGDFLTVCCFKELSRGLKIDNACRIFRQPLPRSRVSRTVFYRSILF